MENVFEDTKIETLVRQKINQIVEKNEDPYEVGCTVSEIATKFLSTLIDQYNINKVDLANIVYQFIATQRFNNNISTNFAIFNYNGDAKIIELNRPIQKIVVEESYGDEIVTVTYKDGTIEKFDSDPERCFNDECFCVDIREGDDVKEWLQERVV